MTLPQDARTLSVKPGSQNKKGGVFITADNATVFIPQWALPDIRRQLAQLQHRLEKA